MAEVVSTDSKRRCKKCGAILPETGKPGAKTKYCPDCWKIQDRQRHTELDRVRRKQPKGLAQTAWTNLNRRAGSDDPKLRCYVNVEVRMTRDEFMAWAIPQYEKWLAERPSELPSVDRIDGAGHYELGNIELIPIEKNRRKTSKQRMDKAPPGTWWCSGCQQYLPYDHFYGKKYTYCKKCAAARAVEWRKEHGNDADASPSLFPDAGPG